METHLIDNNSTSTTDDTTDEQMAGRVDDDDEDIDEDENSNQDNGCALVMTSQQSAVFPNTTTANIQYQSLAALKSETGAVTYRVVQVGDLQGGQHGHHVVTTPTIVSHSVSPQTTIIAHSPFGGGGDCTAAADAVGSVGGGPFYVMMAPTTPQELITHSAPTSQRRNKNAINPHEGHRALRDEKRRATHNEVERRRRDKINNWIVKLSKVVPDCSQDHTKTGQSKGGILAKATEYIQELCLENAKLNDVLKENEILSNELDAIRQQYVDSKNENRKLRAILQRHGISIEDGV